jgi:3',5'-cyclic-AMP phosphodiesterase
MAGRPPRRAARRSAGSMKFIHLTDLHLVPPPRRLYGLDPNARLRAAIADINANHGDAAFVLITGDLAHHGEPAAYEALKDCLRKLALPCHLVIGNHDDRTAFLRAFPAAPVDEGGFVQGVVELGAGVLVLLDTHEPGTHEGRLCERRLAWLDHTLARERGQPVFLAMHHPPLGLALPAMDALALRQQKELAEVLARHGNIRHIFFGHVHRPVHGVWRGIPFSTHRGLNHQVRPARRCTIRYPRQPRAAGLRRRADRRRIGRRPRPRLPRCEPAVRPIGPSGRAGSKPRSRSLDCQIDLYLEHEFVIARVPA